MADTVLDLSAKSQSDLCVYSPRRSADDVSISPSTSPPIATNSDGNESDNSTSMAKMATERLSKSPLSVGHLPASPVSMGHLPIGNHSNPDSGSEDKFDSSGSGSPKPGNSGGRPFKMYPSDAMSIYSNSALMSPAVMSPGLNGALGLSNLYDSASFPSFPITPLTSHLLQRKRRAESRMSSVSTESEPSTSENEVKRSKTVPEEKKDSSYWERRRKNNEAAKRSRDSRRQKEEEIAMRAAFLEQENLKLRAQVSILKNETAKLHYMLYNRL